jgi:hypothetical protein
MNIQMKVASPSGHPSLHPPLTFLPHFTHRFDLQEHWFVELFVQYETHPFEVHL